MGWGAEGMKYRFQWTFPIVVSPHDPDVLYAAGNVLFRSTQRGPELGGDQPRPHAQRPDEARALRAGRSPRTTPASSTTARSSRSPSRRARRALLWAGSDDGLVHVSRDGGKTWTNVTPQGPARVEHDQPDRPLAARPGHARTSRPTATSSTTSGRYVYVTTRLRQELARRSRTGIPADALRARGARGPGAPRPALRGHRDGRLRLVRRRRAAGSRSQLQPARSCPITDLVVKDDDLVVATQGRSFWILDDIAPLRQVEPRARVGATRHLFKPSPAYPLRRAARAAAPSARTRPTARGSTTAEGRRRRRARRSRSRSSTRRARSSASISSKGDEEGGRRSRGGRRRRPRRLRRRSRSRRRPASTASPGTCATRTRRASRG